MRNRFFKVVPLAPFGAEIQDLDLANEIDGAIEAELKAACAIYSFLLFRGQQITLKQQIKFAQIFGEVIDGFDDYQVPKERFVTSSGSIPLHFDHWLTSGYPSPFQFTVLYGLTVSPVGGETVFVNVERILNLLPIDLKSRLVGLNALHCYDYSNKMEPLSDRIRRSQITETDPIAVHPLIIRSPKSKKEILYLSPRNTDSIVEMDEFEGEALIQRLLTYVNCQDFQLEHKWQINDLLIWDNYELLHGRRNYDKKYDRKLRRLCIR